MSGCLTSWGGAGHHRLSEKREHHATVSSVMRKWLQSRHGDHCIFSNYIVTAVKTVTLYLQQLLCKEITVIDIARSLHHSYVVCNYKRYSNVTSRHVYLKALKHRIIAHRLVIAAPLVSSSITINVASYLLVASGMTPPSAQCQHLSSQLHGKHLRQPGRTMSAQRLVFSLKWQNDIVRGDRGFVICTKFISP